jgi:hypothetical protein
VIILGGHKSHMEIGKSHMKEEFSAKAPYGTSHIKLFWAFHMESHMEPLHMGYNTRGVQSLEKNGMSRGGADGPASAAPRGAAQSGFRGLGRAHAPLAIFGLLAGH